MTNHEPLADICVDSQNDNATSVRPEIFEMLPQPPGFTTAPVVEREVMDLDDPDNDWHQMPNTAAVAFLFSFMACLLMSLFFFIYGSFDNSAPIRPLSRIFNEGYLFLSPPLLVLIILHSMVIQSTFERRSSRNYGEVLNVIAHMSMLTFGGIFQYGQFLPLVSVGFYIVYTLCWQARRIKVSR